MRPFDGYPVFAWVSTVTYLLPGKAGLAHPRVPVPPCCPRSGRRGAPGLPECDEEEMAGLENLVSNYANIATHRISAYERDRAIQLARLIRGLRPFLCGRHCLRNLEDNLPEIQRELSLPRA